MMLPDNQPRTVLIGTGVVGRAILDAHIAANVSTCVVDQNTESLRSAVESLTLDPKFWSTERFEINDCPAFALKRVGHQESESVLVIESIAERLDVKRVFFQQAEMIFGSEAILCSNTSTLKISDIASAVEQRGRVCGMHFFMPVALRKAVEIVRTPQSNQHAIDVCQRHAVRINKTPLLVNDSPGFIVNRLLSPYLNQSILLLAHGVSADRIERAARQYGMPISPLELIDWIGTRTMFDAGRAFWQAFPDRIAPSPIAPALVKKKRPGRATGSGIYDYVDQKRSDQLSPVTQQIVQTYALDAIEVTDDDVVHLLSIPMLIEAALAYQSGVVEQIADFEIAMTGGLGYESSSRWLTFFQTIGQQAINESIEKWSPQFKSMNLGGADLARLLHSWNAGF